MITVQGLSKRFGSFVAVHSIDFEIPRGQVVGFLGPNGAGKTTTIRMITGFLPPTAGTATVDGFDVAVHSLPVRRRIGYLPESTPLYTEMRVEEFLRFRAALFGVGVRKRRGAVTEAMERCGLLPVRRRPIQYLSKGFRQRVGLASALVHRPPVLILDEPTNGLDPTQIREVRGLINELAGDHTILLCSHILSEVELLCERLIMIGGGRVRADGTIDQLRERGAGGTRYVVETASPKAAAALTKLTPVHGVQQTDLEGPWQRLTVTAVPSAGDLRETIANTLAALPAPIRELRREATSLEHLFVELTANQGAAVTDVPRGPDSPCTAPPAAEEALA